jgi:hypothetical protein
MVKTYDDTCPAKDIHRLKKLELINEWCPNFLNYLQNDIMDNSTLMQMLKRTFPAEFDQVTCQMADLTVRKIYNKCDETLSIQPHHELYNACEYLNSFILYHRFTSYPDLEKKF